MTDWTTCRVVRAGGELWGRSDGNWWSKLGYYWPMGDPEALQSTPSLAEYDPTPVLDADGLPVVTTVGDLTARHLRRDISVEGMRTATLLAMRIPPRNQPLPLAAFLVRIDGTIGTTDYYPLDAPCEVLP